MWVATAIIGSSVLGGITGMIGANKQASAQEQAAQEQMSMFNTINQQEQPFMQAGYGATTQLNDLLGIGSGTPSGGLPNGYLNQTFNPTQAQMNQYPGYQFALNVGGQAVRNADTPGVGALSGPALKDLTSFNVGTANQFYNQYFNQFQTQQNNIFSRLSGIAGLGSSAAAHVGAAGTQLGQGAAQATAGAGASLGAGYVGVGNSAASGAQSLAMLPYLQSQTAANNSLASLYGS